MIFVGVPLRIEQLAELRIGVIQKILVSYGYPIECWLGVNWR